MNFITKQCAK